nr:MAG TPA: hypothetical protein [Caudoviricetes sp.]
MDCLYINCRNIFYKNLIISTWTFIPFDGTMNSYKRERNVLNYERRESKWKIQN